MRHQRRSAADLEQAAAQLDLSLQARELAAINAGTWRGFEWLKWVVRVELHDGPDPGAPASTVWSSFTPEGRGAA
jgi:hypothetical protein